ncbi:hypothetical protein N7457_003201 [Penicillium paradoxum]|uniref:uncharacterized protein n=1 Tax=Penicillium paradoxum TaxID=176176 RepID=UPI002546718F|nr:uncharacterized protein N7457_003201 [Penicillium paradoxum]KAJ5788211.1 hypothetical protein N7457_003201 [Penicillium paradoxum]
MTEEPGKSPILGEPPNAVLTDSRPTPARETRTDDREALELQQIQTCEDNDIDYSSPSASSGEEYVSTRRTTSRPDSRRELEARTGLWSWICRFWNRHVSLTVPQKSNRDHFGKFTPHSQGTLLTIPLKQSRSPGKNVPCIHPYVHGDRHARGSRRSTLPPATTLTPSRSLVVS